MADPTLTSSRPITHTPKPDGDAEAACCWCNKIAGNVKKLLSQGSYHICNECVALCADVLRMELGDDFG
jgi:hypothetical protein